MTSWVREIISFKLNWNGIICGLSNHKYLRKWFLVGSFYFLQNKCWEARKDCRRNKEKKNYSNKITLLSLATICFTGNKKIIIFYNLLQLISQYQFPGWILWFLYVFHIISYDLIVRTEIWNAVRSWCKISYNWD